MWGQQLVSALLFFCLVVVVVHCPFPPHFSYLFPLPPQAQAEEVVGSVDIGAVHSCKERHHWRE